MVRASAKNHANVIICCNPMDYDSIIADLQKSEGNPSGLPISRRQELALTAYQHTASYDVAIANTLHADGTVFPKPLTPLKNNRVDSKTRFLLHPSKWKRCDMEKMDIRALLYSLTMMRLVAIQHWSQPTLKVARQCPTTITPMQMLRCGCVVLFPRTSGRKHPTPVLL